MRHNETNVRGRVKKQRTQRVLLYTVLIVFAVLYLLPIWGAFTTSFKSPKEVDTTNPLLPPRHFTITPYMDAFAALKRPLLNSLLITLGGVAGSVALGSIVGYVFSWVRFKYDTWIFMAVVIGIFLPYQSVVIPLYATMLKLGLYTKIPGLILTHTAYGIPICAFLFRNFYEEIPKSIVRQAKLDGAGSWKIYRRIVLPLTKPAIVTVVVYQFTSIWNDFLFGLILGGAETQAMPVTVALNNLTGAYAALWNDQMAGAVMVSLPVLLLYIFLGKYLVRGYMAGGVTAT